MANEQLTGYASEIEIPRPFGLVSVPDNFDLNSPGPLGGYANLTPIVQWNWNPTNTGQNLFLPAEKQFGLGDDIAHALVPFPIPTANFIEKVYPRGQVLAPETASGVATIMFFRVPQAGIGVINSFCLDFL